LIESLHSPTAPILIDDPAKVGPAASEILKVASTRAFQDATRGQTSTLMLHFYLANCFVFTSNALKVMDDATRSRFMIFRITERLARQTSTELYGAVDENAFLELVAHAINTRWDDIEALWHWERQADVRYDDFLRVLEFGARLISLALGLPPTEPDFEAQKLEIPLSPINMIEEIATAEGQDVAGAIARLLGMLVATNDSSHSRTTLGAALVTRNIAKSEYPGLEARGILPSRRGGVWGIRVDMRWAQQERLGNLRSVQTYLSNFGVDESPHPYGGRWRLFIPVPDLPEDIFNSVTDDIADDPAPTATERSFFVQLGFGDWRVLGCFESLDEMLGIDVLATRSKLETKRVKRILTRLARDGHVAESVAGKWRRLHPLEHGEQD
jgi:hypothetical protein